MIVSPKKIPTRLSRGQPVLPFLNFPERFQDILLEDTKDFIDYFYSQSGDAYVSLRREIGKEWTKEEIAAAKLWKFKKLTKQRDKELKEMDEIEAYFKSLDISDPLRKQFQNEKLHLFNEVDAHKRIYRRAYYKSPELEFEEEYDSTDPEKCFKLVKPNGAAAVILKGKELKIKQELLPVEHPQMEPLGSGLDSKFKQFCIIIGQKNEELREFVLNHPELTVGQLVKKAKRDKLL